MFNNNNLNETQKQFLENGLKEIDAVRTAIKNDMEDEYKALDVYQKNVYAEIIRQLEGFEALFHRYQNECADK